MTAVVETITRDELLSLVDARRKHVGHFLDWAEEHQRGSWSMYLAERPDIKDAREAATLFAPRRISARVPKEARAKCSARTLR